MITRQPSAVKLLKRIAEMGQVRRDLEKEEKGLKAQLRTLMGDEAILIAGDFCAMRETKHMSSLDKDGLISEIGVKVYEKYLEDKTYETLTIKPVKVGG